MRYINLHFTYLLTLPLQFPKYRVPNSGANVDFWYFRQLEQQSDELVFFSLEMYDFILVFYNNQAALGEVRIRNKQKKDISLYPTQEYLADAEIPGHASCYLPPKYKAPHFLYPTQPTGLSQKKNRDHRMLQSR